MANSLHIEGCYNVRILRVLYAAAIVTTFVILFQRFVVPYENYISLLSHANFSMLFMTVSNTTLSNESSFSDADIVVSGKVNGPDSGLDQEVFEGRGGEGMYGGQYSSEEQNEKQLPSDFTYDRELASDKLGKISEFEATENHSIQDGLKNGFELTEKVKKPKTNVTQGRSELVSEISHTSLPDTAVNVTLLNNDQRDLDMQSIHKGEDLVQSGPVSANNSSVIAGTSIQEKKSKRKPTSISDMNALLDRSLTSTNSLVFHFQSISL